MRGLERWLVCVITWVYVFLLTAAAVIGIGFIIAGFAGMYQKRQGQESTSDEWKKVALGGALNMIVAILVVVSVTIFGSDQTSDQLELIQTTWVDTNTNPIYIA